MKILLRYLPIVLVLLVAGAGTYVGLDSISSNPHLAVDEETETNQPAPTATTSPPATTAPPRTTTTAPRTTTTLPETTTTTLPETTTTTLPETTTTTLPETTTTTLPATTTTTAVPSTTATSPQAVVEEFYAAINVRDFRRAWDLGGKNLSRSYDGWVAGFANTLYVSVTTISSIGDTVHVSIRAYQTSGEVEIYNGSYTIRDGAIVSANVIRALAHNPFS